MARIKDYPEYFVFQILKALIFILPRKLCISAGKIFGLTLYYLDRRHRRIALSNLNIAFGKELPSNELKKIARGSFKHFGSVLMDIIKFPRLSEKKKNQLIRVEGEEHLRRALRENKGVITFSAHFGSWEIIQYFISQMGKFTVIARALDNTLLEKELLKLRTRHGSRVIYKHQATKHILKSLRAKEIVGFLIDQNVQKHQAVFIDFFGKKAATTPVLAVFFLKTGAPLVPFFCFPTSSSIHQIQFLKPLEIEQEGDYDQQVLKITQLCTKIIEAQIRKNPAHWFWLHDRWRTRPDDEKED
ncbi:MAG: lysophospholipid acyltransferase family protein [Candidatus Aminicenantes bacterium]|nr:lysophospholipid acyltransferase family protein [Candidatus Aminicenantes bacterium]MDH5704491.1 lysophospholipid acyltransferase family protein [Candidatus Aminicenantes bacterium]